MRRLALVLVAAAACADLRSAPDDGTRMDGGTPSNASSSSGNPTLTDAGVDPDTGLLPPTPEAGLHPADPCRPVPTTCLNASSPSIIEVPTEATLEQALAAAQPLDIVQLRGGTYDGVIDIPKDVGLIGCEGATIIGQVSLKGGVQGVADLTFRGSLNITAKGSYNLTRNHFSIAPPADDTRYAVLISTISAPIGTDMAVAINDSSFTGRSFGITASTNPNAGPNGIKLTIQNAVFSRVRTPLSMTEIGRHPMSLTVTSSSFYDFGTAISLSDLSAVSAVEINASYFVKGTSAVNGAAGTTGNAAYRWNYSFAWNVSTPLASPPQATPTLTTTVDPMFVDPEKDDLRLGPTSLAVNRISPVVAVPPKDFQGCPRPIANATDPGAFESQF